MLIPVGVALGAFGVAASDAVNNVIRHFTSLHTVMDATGTAIYPMTGALEKLHDAVQPDVYQILGDALLVANSRMGELSKLAMGTGQVLDQLAARASVALESAGVSKFLQNAIPDVAKLGDVVGNIFGIIGNLLKTMPGYAEILLNILDGVTKGLEAFTGSGIVQGIIRTGLALHGLFVYGGLAATAVLALRGPLTSVAVSALSGAARIGLVGSSAVGMAQAMGASSGAVSKLRTNIGLAAAAAGDAEGKTGLLTRAMGLLSAVPVWGWAALGAAALAGLIFWLANTKTATQQWIGQLQAGINSQTTWTGLLRSLGSAQQQVGQQITATTKQLASTQEYQNGVNLHTGDTTRVVSAAYSEQQQKLSDLRGAQQKFSSEQQTATLRLALLGSQVGGTSAALGLMSQAHVKVSDAATASAHAWAQDVQQVLALQEGLRAMSDYAAGNATTSLQVLDQQASDQYQAIQKVNSAWDTFIGNATKTQLAFDTYMTGLSGIASAAGKSAAQVESAQAAQASAQNTLNNLQSRGGASALQLTAAQDRLAAAHDRLAAVEKSRTHTSAQLASAQASVASAQNTLSNLQSRGGASAQQLAAAHDRLAAATSRLNSLQSRGAATMDGLNAASIALNQAFAQQVSNTNALYDSWRTAGISSDLFTRGVKASIAPLLQYARGSQEATDQLVGLAEEAGYQGPASLSALTKWLGSTSHATQTLKDVSDQATRQAALLTGAMHAQGNEIAGQLLGDINQAILKYDGVTRAAVAYGQAVAQDGRDSDAAHAARQTLIDDLIKSGKAAGDSAGQIAAMITKVTGIPAKRALQLVMTGTGTYSVQQLTANLRAAQYARANQGAKGLYVRDGTTPTADDVVARVSKGELIVPAHMVRAGAVDHLRGRIPGFAAGGLVETGNRSVLTGQYAVASYDKFTKTLTDAVATALKQELLAGGGTSVAGGAVQRLAQQMAAAFGWTGAQWTALNNLEMREAGWNMRARNPTSGAYGIAQGISGPSWYYQWPGGNPGTAQGQVIGLLDYIAQRYGSPMTAWAHETAFNWYASGGIIPEPVIGVGLRSGRGYGFGENGPETVTPGAGGARDVNINIAEMNVRHESDAALVAQRLSGMIRSASLGGGSR